MDNSDEIELVSDNPQAWVFGQSPPQGPSKGTSTVPRFTQPPLHAVSDHILPPGYVPNYNIHAAPGTSNERPPVAPVRNTHLVVSGTPVYTIPPPPPVTRPNNEPPSPAYDGQYYSPNMAFKVSAPHNLTPQYKSPVENEKPAKLVEPDKMARKMKNVNIIQVLRGIALMTVGP
uniref:Pollen-specific leucine-rich repeat extensin-like protein 4 n=1 Tax=Nicotiana tabacum TaxID=4097 RepID=A0A1S3XVC5_TOBAC|nr:PREDICTED: pollen-specific leucine-rich repeat extensin-like protein 4 [Nicotiana tabacum]